MTGDSGKKPTTGGQTDFYGRDKRGEDQSTSHGHSGDSAATPVPGYQSYGGGGRDDVGGGPAGRGNTDAKTVDTGRDWGRGDEQEGNDGIPEKAKPVADKSGGKNAFSKP